MMQVGGNEAQRPGVTSLSVPGSGTGSQPYQPRETTDE